MVVVCYQTDHVVGKMGSRFSRMIEKNIVGRIEEAIDYNDDIYFVMDNFEEGFFKTPEGKRYPAKHCIRGTKGAELYGKVNDYSSNGHVIVKKTYGSEALVDSLKMFDEIEICGVDTHTSVLVNAMMIRTRYPKSKVTVIRNCVAAKDSELGEAALEMMEQMGVDLE